MKNLYKKLIFTPLIFVLLFSCEDYLTKAPLDRPSVSTFLKSEEEFELALNGAYEKLWYNLEYGLPIEQHLDLASDIGWSRAFVNFQFLGNGKVDPSTSVIFNMWNHFYSGIQRCNYILENSENIGEVENEERYSQIISETLFLRAYFYYHLTEMFGDVPFIINVLSIEESYVGKTEKEEIIDFILEDLEKASINLPISYSDGNLTGRITKGAALALKSRIALFNQRWETAIDASERVMELNYQLQDDYASLFIKEGQDISNEIIFMLQYQQGVKTHLAPKWIVPRMASGFAGLIPTQSMVDSYMCVDGLPIDESPLYNPSDPFVNRDPRLNLSIVVPGSVFHGYQYETHLDSLLCWNYNVSPPVRVPNQDAINPFASFTGYCWRKYADRRDPSYLEQSETGIIFIRYAEVLLNFIEAKVEANKIDQAVYDALNAIRERVNMPFVFPGKTQEELRSIVRMERKVELAFEGLRLYDIRRWKIAEDVLDGPLYGRIQRGLLESAPEIDTNGTPDYSIVPNRSEMRVIEVREFNDRNYLWPIPQFEIDINNALTQNVGY